MKKLIVICMLAAIGAVTMIERSYAAGEGRSCDVTNTCQPGQGGVPPLPQQQQPGQPQNQGNWQGGGNWNHHHNYGGVQPYFGFQYNGDPNYDQGPDPYYDRPQPAYSRCSDLSEMLRERGYRNVHAIDCAGPSFVYRAIRAGRPVVVTVSARSGTIRSVARAY